jgi:hypothetical protein
MPRPAGKAEAAAAPQNEHADGGDLVTAAGVFGLLQDYTPVIDGETIFCHMVSN